MIIVDHGALTPYSFLNDESKKTFISPEQYIIPLKETLLVPVGFSIASGENNKDAYVLIFEISDSMAQKGLQLKNSPCVIPLIHEKTFCLEIANNSKCSVQINKGEILGAFVIRKER